METCLQLDKCITGLGLFIDLVGIYVLLKNEIEIRNIESLKAKGANSDGLKYSKERTDLGFKDPISITNRKAMIAEDRYPPRKALLRSKFGLYVLLLGFFLQIVALFLSDISIYCRTITN